MGEEEQFQASMRTSLAYCRGLGAGLLHIMAGRLQEGVTRDQAMGTFRNNIRCLVQLLSCSHTCNHRWEIRIKKQKLI